MNAYTTQAEGNHTLLLPSTGIAGLYASDPQPLPFAPDLDIRAFVIRRTEGNLLIYSTKELNTFVESFGYEGGVARQYLNHWHEAMFASDLPGVPIHAHERDAESVEERAKRPETFVSRHTVHGDFEVIPTPGHTSGATAYLWDNGEHRVLFTGDSLYLHKGRWVAAVLKSSDRAAYIESLELVRDLEFDVLVPWAASRGYPYHAFTTREDATKRIEETIARLRSGRNY